MRNYSEWERLAHITSRFEYGTQRAYTKTLDIDMMQNYFILKHMASPPHFYKEPSHTK